METKNIRKNGLASETGRQAAGWTLQPEVQKTLLSTISLAVGGLIYVLFRSDSLLMFVWFEDVGLGHFIRSPREAVEPALTYLPSWIFYSLPSALWLFSGLLALCVIWKRSYPEKIIWCSLFCACAIGSEFGQQLRIVPGTYDNVDVGLMVIFGLLGFMFGSEEAGNHRE